MNRRTVEKFIDLFNCWESDWPLYGDRQLKDFPKYIGYIPLEDGNVARIEMKLLSGENND